MRAFEKVSLARVFFAIVVRRPPSVDTKVLSRKRRRDDGSICDIIAILNERRDMMTTTSDAFESNRILFTRDQIGTQVSFLPAFASSSASPNRKAGAPPPPLLPFATIATAPHAATPATASAIVFRDDVAKAPLNKGGFFSSAFVWVLCNNGASSA